MGSVDTEGMQENLATNFHPKLISNAQRLSLLSHLHGTYPGTAIVLNFLPIQFLYPLTYQLQVKTESIDEFELKIEFKIPLDFKIVSPGSKVI